MRRYTLIDLSPYGARDGDVCSLNDVGQAAGHFGVPPARAEQWEPCLWHDLGRMRTLLRSYGMETASAVNSRGWVAGTNVAGLACLWRDGGLVRLGTLPGCRWSTATALNDAGDVAGTAFPASTPADRKAFLCVDGELTDLGTLGERETQPFDINGERVVVGAERNAGERPRPFVWREGKIAVLPTLDGEAGEARAVNVRGDIIGWTETADGRDRAVRWRDGAVECFDDARFYESYAHAMNEGGEVVGRIQYGAERGFAVSGLVLREGVMVNLNDVTDLPEGFRVYRVSSINSHGIIGGTAIRGAEVHPVLLLPV